MEKQVLITDQRLTAAFDRAAREVGLAEKRVEK